MPPFDLRTLRSEGKRLVARLKRFGECQLATDMWATLGVPDPAKMRDLNEREFIELAKLYGETAHDAR